MSTRVFKDKQTLQSLIKLRQKGYTYHSLAFIFNVDFSSIYHHVKEIRPEGHLVLNVRNIISPMTVDVPHIIKLLDIKLRTEKSYKDYLKESRVRALYPNINRLSRIV